MSVVHEFMARMKERRDRSDGGLPRTIEVDDGVVRVHVRLLDEDRFTFLLDRIEVVRLAPGPDGSVENRVTAQAEFLPKRLTYLLEDLTVTELDHPHDRAQLRSTAPDLRDGASCFYEVILDQGRAVSLVRCRYDQTSGVKSTTPLVMTIEILGRVLDDLIAALWVEPLFSRSA